MQLRPGSSNDLCIALTLARPSSSGRCPCPYPHVQSRPSASIGAGDAIAAAEITRSGSSAAQAIECGAPPTRRGVEAVISERVGDRDHVADADGHGTPRRDDRRRRIPAVSTRCGAGRARHRSRRADRTVRPLRECRKKNSGVPPGGPASATSSMRPSSAITDSASGFQALTGQTYPTRRAAAEGGVRRAAAAPARRYPTTSARRWRRPPRGRP